MRSRQRSHRGDQLIAHAGHEEPAESALPIRDAERGVSRSGQLPRAVDEPLQDLVDRQLRCDGQDRVADGLQRGAERLRHAAHDSFADVPRLWFWTQVLIVVFVLAGMVIAITKL